MLKELCKTYISIVDNYPLEQSRSIVHNLVMDVFKELGIDYENREHAAMIARAIAMGEKLTCEVMQ